MVSFFERGGRFVRYETRECSTGQYELTTLDADGSEKIEIFHNADAWIAVWLKSNTITWWPGGSDRTGCTSNFRIPAVG